MQQGGTGAHFGEAILHPHGAQGQPGIHVAIEAGAADGAAIPPPGRALMPLDIADRPGLGRPGHGHGPGMAEETVERVEFRAQHAVDMIDRVDQPGIEFDLPSADDLDAAGFADPGFVVAIDIGAHGQLGLVLGRIEQGADALGILDRIAAARDGAADRTGLDSPAFDPDEHLGRGGDQELAVA